MLNKTALASKKLTTMKKKHLRRCFGIVMLKDIHFRYKIDLFFRISPSFK